jgi:5-methylcytosine-specific restriction endonuclease McrA
MAKEWAKQFYHSKAWLKVRKLVMIRDYYTCVHCGEAASIVHHIEELSPENINDPLISLNMDNLESVCHDCHNDIHDMCKTQSTQDGFKFDSNGDIIEVYKHEKLRED